MPEAKIFEKSRFEKFRAGNPNESKRIPDKNGILFVS
jgi:hypothetical protein